MTDRPPSSLRSLEGSTAILHRADGSARVLQGTIGDTDVNLYIQSVPALTALLLSRLDFV